MKKYVNFITEGLSSDEIKEMLNKDCSQFLREGVILYRGMNKDIPEYEIMKRQHNRRPKDMPTQIHHMIDKLLEKEFGWKPRSSGVFATASINDAKFYSKYTINPENNSVSREDPYIFVPKGEYQMVYNPGISDLYPYIKTILDEIFDDDFYVYGRPSIDDEIMKELEEHLIELVEGFQDYDIVDAASNYNEIMFDCDEYYLFNIKYKSEIQKWF